MSEISPSGLDMNLKLYFFDFQWEGSYTVCAQNIEDALEYVNNPRFRFQNSMITESDLTNVQDVSAGVVFVCIGDQ